MSEFRFDPVKRKWVILADQRGHRPSQFQSSSQTFTEPEICPFCPGNESMTPPEVYALRTAGTDPDSTGWQVRVVPNKYPALSTDHPLEPFSDGIHRSIQGFGVHEIIIETPVKNRQMADMDNWEISMVLTVIRERMKVHLTDGRFRAVILFKNHGKDAGASLVHSHTQLMALPLIPDNVALQLESFTDYLAREDRCLMCDILAREVAENDRMVYDENGYMVVVPFASSSPFQVNIVPKTHGHEFSLSGDSTLNRLAPVLGKTLRCLRSVLGEHPWNMVLHNAPVGVPDETIAKAYHWFLEITPRLINPAGFEMGSGFYINTIAPEECAALLREQGLVSVF